MATTPLTDLARRLLVNVDANRGDYAESMMTIPAEEYRDPRSIRQGNRGRLPAQSSVGRPVGGHSRAGRLHDDRNRRAADRGDARRRRRRPDVPQRLPAPWRAGRPGLLRPRPPDHVPLPRLGLRHPGQLVGVPGREAFDELDVDGLVEYPTARAGRRRVRHAHGRSRVRHRGVARRHGDGAGDAAARQAPPLRRRDQAAAAATGRRPPTATSTATTSATCTRTTIGAKSITNRNTYDLYGPHVRIGFANKPITEIARRPAGGVADMYGDACAGALRVPEHLDLGPARSAADGQPPAARARRRTGRHGVQYQYFREPVEGDEADRRRPRPSASCTPHVTDDEDFVTGFKITRRARRAGRRATCSASAATRSATRTCTAGSTTLVDGVTSVGHRAAVDREHAAGDVAGRRRRPASRRPQPTCSTVLHFLIADSWANRSSIAS